MLKLFICSVFFSTHVFAATVVSQKMGVYTDNLDSDRQRVDLGLLHSVKSKGVLDQTDIGLNLGYDHLTQADLENQDAEIETREFQLLVSQTWDKLTTTRLSAGRQVTDERPGESYGVGVSRWVFNEQLQISLDGFKNNSIRDVIEILDQDSEVIAPPRYFSSQGGVIAFRHLANPKTVFNYGYTYISSNDRPDLWSATAGARRFLENPWSSKYHAAIQLSYSRIDNTGELDTTTAIGNLQGDIYQINWLQNLGDSQRARIGYRQYRETEVTRVNEDEYFLGTDLLSGQYVIEFDKKTFANFDYPLSVEGTVHRYLTNAINDEGSRIAANIYEFGLSAKF